jgi:hypothetical protein
MKTKNETLSFKEYLNQDDSYFSEGHLTAWFASIYRGNTRAEVKYQLENVSDNEGEIENCENEIGRELTDKEKDILLKRFYKAVYKSIVWKRGIAVAYMDSLNKINVD